jgi:thiamine biosynthesis lipoprotein
MIPLADTAISTSGDYERFFMQDGVRFHHILDPGTGRSAQGVQSATIVAPRAIDTDALSTTAFVLGVQRGLELINSLPGVDAIIIDGQGKLHYSADLLLSTTP